MGTKCVKETSSNPRMFLDMSAGGGHEDTADELDLA